MKKKKSTAIARRQWWSGPSATKVRDAVGRQHFAVFHHVNVASEKHEASSHIIIFSGKPCNLVLVPPIYAGLLPVCLLYVCMFHTEVCELINVLPPGPAYLYNNNNASISSRWFDSQMTHLPTLRNSVLTIQHACPLYLMEGYVHQHKTAWKNAHCNIQYNQKTEMANPHDPSVMICSEASFSLLFYV